MNLGSQITQYGVNEKSLTEIFQKYVTGKNKLQNYFNPKYITWVKK